MNPEIPIAWLEGFDRLLYSIAELPEAAAPKPHRCEHGPWIWLGETKDGMESAWRCARCGLEVLQ